MPPSNNVCPDCHGKARKLLKSRAELAKALSAAIKEHRRKNNGLPHQQVSIRLGKPKDISFKCPHHPSLLACPKEVEEQAKDIVLTDDLKQQEIAVKKQEDDARRKKKEASQAKARLQIDKANDRLKKLAGISETQDTPEK